MLCWDRRIPGHKDTMLPCLVLVSVSCLPQILGAVWEGASAPTEPGTNTCKSPDEDVCSLRWTQLRMLHPGGGAGLDSCSDASAPGEFSGAAYLRLTLVAPSALDSVLTQQFLRTVRVPRAVADTASTITALAVTTECDTLQWGSRECRCLPGYQWSGSICKRFQACGGLFQAFAPPIFSSPCDCLRWTSPEPGYCVPLLEASTVSDSQHLPPKHVSVGAGEDLTLSFSLKEGATDVKFYLTSSEESITKEICNGTQAMLLRNGSVAMLRISSVSPDWAGAVLLYGVNNFSLNIWSGDVTQTLSQVSMNCSSPEKLTLQCCIQHRGKDFRASWNPGAPAPADLVGTEDPLCHFLTLDSCPSRDTTYQCQFESDSLGSVQTTVLVSVIQAGDLFCPSEDAEGRWNSTKAGQVAELLCPKGSDGKMLRSCSSEGTWEDIQSNCTRQQLLSGLRRAQLLRAGLGSPQTEVHWLTDWLKMETEPTHTQERNPWDLLTVLDTMDSISQVALGVHMRLEGSVVANLLCAANWLLDLDPEAEWSAVQALSLSAGSKLLQVTENLPSLLLPPPGGFNLTLSNIELQSVQLESDLVDDFRKTFDTEPSLHIRIAKEELDALVHRGQNITIISLVLKKLAGMLPGGHGGAKSSHSIGSLLMSNTIMSSNGSIKQIETEMTFGHWNITSEMEEELVAHCVFWDHSLLEGVGGWSTEGCQTSSSKMATNCSCRHLTSFSILMSANPVPSSFALTFLSKFGICASILALVATLTIYYLIWTSVVKNKVAYFRYTSLANISLSLLMGNFWFLGASQLTAHPESKLCVAAAFFTHFSYLATFFWMLVQAFLLFHQLVFVFHPLTIRTVVPAMVTVGYLCPFVIAVATVAVFCPKQGYIQETFCRLSCRSKAIYTFSVPVLVIVTANVLILFVVLLTLVRPSVSEGPKGEEWKALLGIFKALLILTPVFGLTWGLGIITMTMDASALTHCAFTVLNSFQGVFILLFGCLMDKKVRGALYKRLCEIPIPSRSMFKSQSETLDSKLSN